MEDKKQDQMEEEVKDTSETTEEKVEEGETENTSSSNDLENELRDNLIRLQADFQNYKRRSEKEKQGSIDYGIEKIVCQLLPVIDNLERALEAKDDKEEPFYKGVEMIYGQILDVLKNNNVEEIDSIGEKFDPSFHHAIGVEKVEDKESGMVIDLLQKGYVLKDKVIRPAMVRVSE